MTYRKFRKLYQHYKNNFDLETKLRSKGMTYAELAKLTEKYGGDGEWFD